MKTATVAANSAAPTAMSVISHPAIPAVITVWTTVGCGWDTVGCVRASDGNLPLAYDRAPGIMANAEGAKRAKLNKLPQIARTTVAVRRTNWKWFMDDLLSCGGMSLFGSMNRPTYVALSDHLRIPRGTGLA